ncbi:MAG: efflux RND transporter periplasmic adaptor subunit, partial [Gammaproteobacteria bacterium]|nr:efflux RND transporter periplasmic adaptor subunit [Gammaproteobacteria bacterium]
MLLFFSGVPQLRNRDVLALSPIKISLLVFLYLLLTACSPSPDTTAGKTEESAAEHAVKHLQSHYVCPMHPKISRDAPASCPICGMDLVKQKITRSKDNSIVIDLTPNVIQKLGVKTEAVEKGRLWKYIKTVGYVTYDENRVKVIRAPTDGWVENLGVRRAGLQVKKGQLLMELYSPEFLAAQKTFIAAQKKDKSGVLKKYGQR